jgi:hypothetical protein
MGKRPWAIWKVVLLVFVGGCVAIGIITGIVISDGARRADINSASGGALFFVMVAAAMVQAWRLRRYDEAAAQADVGESIVATTSGQRIVDGRAHRGRLDLTATRILFYRATRYNGVLGDLIALLGSTSRRYRSLDLTLAEIASTKRSEFRSVLNGLDVTMADGSEHRFTLDLYPVFDTALRKAREPRT